MSENENFPSISIEKIKFKNHDDVFNFNENDIVLFVGANNVGKSRTLKDIKERIDNNSYGNTILIDKIDFKEHNFSQKNIEDYFDKYVLKETSNSYLVVLDDNMNRIFYKTEIEQLCNANSSNYPEFYKLFYTFLSTENRLNLTKPYKINISNNNKTLDIINKLRIQQESIIKLNQILKHNFGMGIDVDDSQIINQPQISYKIGNSDTIDKIIHSERREVYSKLEKMEDLHEQGDGIRSAVAILASLIVNENSLYLIDEPETFLHPPQARQLGRDIVDLSKNKQCFISTHNIDFIRGVLETDPDRVKIIKIDRNDNDNEYNLLDNESICSISKDKNLKYSNILNGLFYDRVVLCEDESDCKFYSAILESLDLKIYQKTLFCAVGGKDQFKKIVPLLISLHIKYCIIADLDLINDSSKLSDLINSISPDNYEEIKQTHTSFLNMFQNSVTSQVKNQESIRKEIVQIFDEKKSDEYMTSETANKIKNLLKKTNSFHLLKECGVYGIPNGNCRVEYENLHDFLVGNNIYLVEVGEIEKFIPTVSGHGPKWVNSVFETYPDLNDIVYKDVREFISNVFQINS